MRLARQGLEGVAHALEELPAALATGNHEVRIGIAHAREHFRVAGLDLGIGEALGDAVVAFAEAGIGVDAIAGARGDHLGGPPGAPEVARDEPVEFLRGQARGDGGRLRLTCRGEGAVLVTLDARGAVPLRLAVADDDDTRAQLAGPGFAPAISLSMPPM